MTGLMSQDWTSGGMYTNIYTSACIPPTGMYRSQTNPGPHPGRWMLCEPSAVHPVMGWGADTPPKPWAPISQQSLVI